MTDRFVSGVVRTTHDLLAYGAILNEYETNLSQLSSVITLTAADEVVREFIVQCPSSFHLTLKALGIIFIGDTPSKIELHSYLRTLRGLLLLIRNLCISSSANYRLADVTSSMQTFRSKVDRNHELFAPCLQAYLQLLANLLNKHRDTSILSSNDFYLIADEFTTSYIARIDRQGLDLPFKMILKVFLEDPKIVQQIMEDEARHFILSFIFNVSSEQLEKADIPARTSILIERVISKKSFTFWLASQTSFEKIERTLILCQLVISDKSDWSPTELSNMIDWSYKLASKSASESVQLLKSRNCNSDQLRYSHSKLIRSLDIVTSLCHFDSVISILQGSAAIEMFVSLLRTVHENTDVLTPRTRQPANENPRGIATVVAKEFPLVKTLLIEILTFMCHDSYEAQEKMRELHGLELILSNCLIDEHNPFIKEHAVLCLRFLLQNNPKNQEFVASLEAKQVVDGDALADVGYEVSIENGKVKIKDSVGNPAT